MEEIEENMSKAYGRALPISTKKSVEICNHLRYRKVVRAKTILENVIEQKEAIPMKRYNRDTAHKKEIAAGKYPVNAAKEILNMIKSAESNAQSKGLSTKDLVIKHLSASKASQPWHYGRKRRSRMKRTHIQVVLMEKKSTKKSESNKK